MKRKILSNECIQHAILNQIYKLRKGAVFTPCHFLHLGNRDAVDVTLHRLAKTGDILRIARGIYYFPKTHPVLGILLPPAEKIAEAASEKGHHKLLPTGAYAANLLRLSEQVPAKYEYLSDGPSKKICTGKLTIEIKQTTLPLFKTSTKEFALIVLAFKYIGKPNINFERIEHLKELLPFIVREKLINDIAIAPAWMHPFIRYIASTQRSAI